MFENNLWRKLVLALSPAHRLLSFSAFIVYNLWRWKMMKYTRSMGEEDYVQYINNHILLIYYAISLIARNVPT